MQFVTDLHLHSKYSRAVSPQMTLPVMARLAQQKGLDILSACDFTHPVWFKEVSVLLQEETEGLYVLKSEADSLKKTHFLFSTEIASIYKQGEKLRRIHNLVFAPNIETVEKINSALVKRGCNLNADGRPIIGLTSKQLLELILEINERSFLIPAHVWTPHFGIYGSASGFDSLEEAFGDMSKYIYGIETGLSSDPDMNWSRAELKTRSILSFSDAHSAPKMAREATIFTDKDGEASNKSMITYNDIRLGIMRDSNARLKIGYTIEFYPEEGKYHFSGHRNCKVSYGPEEIKDKGNVCPVCHRRMTEGVLYRVQQLGEPELLDRREEKPNAQGLLWHADKDRQQPPYVKLVPLLEIIAESMKSTVNSQKVQAIFNTLCSKLESEIHILLKAPIEEIAIVAGERVAEGVDKVRKANIVIEPGYDGEYGKVAIWKEGEEHIEHKSSPQLSLDF